MVCTSTVLKEFLNSGETKAPRSGYTKFRRDMVFFMSSTRFGKEEKVVKKPRYTPSNPRVKELI